MVKRISGKRIDYAFTMYHQNTWPIKVPLLGWLEDPRFDEICGLSFFGCDLSHALGLSSVQKSTSIKGNSVNTITQWPIKELVAEVFPCLICRIGKDLRKSGKY